MMQLDAIARTHHGLITRHQAAAIGVSTRAFERAIAAGHLERLWSGVARLAGAPITRSQGVLAAVYACGPESMTSHRSAAWVWGVERPANDAIDVITARDRHPGPRGVVVHRPTDVRQLRAVYRGAIPVVTPMRMLIDLGAVDPAGVGDALDHVIATRLMRFEAIDGALTRLAGRGRHGVTALRVALEERRIDGKPSDSALEVRMAQLTERYPLPPMQFHAEVAGFEVDFLVTDTPLVIECVGWRAHGFDRDQFEFDTYRRAELAAAGYMVVEITWRMLLRQPGVVADRILRVLSAFSGDLATQLVARSPENG